MKDFSIQLQVRNNHLKERRDALGITAAELCRRLKISQDGYSRLERLKTFPINKKGEWTKIANTLAAFYRCLPEDLFPQEVEQVTGGVTSGEIKANAPEMLQLVSSQMGGSVLSITSDNPEEILMRKEWLEKASAGLNEREVHTLIGAAFSDTLVEIGQSMPGNTVSKNRAKQMQLRALQHVRRFSHIKELQTKAALDWLRLLDELRCLLRALISFGLKQRDIQVVCRDQFVGLSHNGRVVLSRCKAPDAYQVNPSTFMQAIQDSQATYGVHSNVWETSGARANFEKIKRHMLDKVAPAKHLLV